MSEQIEMFGAEPIEPAAKPDAKEALYLEACRLLGEGRQVGDVLAIMLLASFGVEISGTELLALVMRASRRGRGWRMQ